MSNLYLQLSGAADPAAIFAHTDGAAMRYADVQQRSAMYANALVSMGVVPGDRVAVQADKSLDMLMLYLGCLRAGAVFLPLNTAYTVSELDYFIADAEPALLVVGPARLEDIRAMPSAAGVTNIETLGAGGAGSLVTLVRQSSPEFATVERDDGDLAAILYTSGTTGRSKGAMLTHGNLGSNAFALRDAWRFSADDVLLHALPIFHTHGLFVATNVTLAAGSSMIFLPKFDIDAIIDALPHATVMMGVPTFYLRLLEDPRFDRALVSHMRLFISGSAPLPIDTFQEFEARTGHKILERYGMTETNMNTSNPYAGERIAGTVGLPLPGVEVRITDPHDRRVLPNGEVGVIEVSGPNVLPGYWRNPEKTASEIRDGFFITGDLGRIDERGYVSIVGREKDLIIAGGYNIYPAEVENAIGAHASVQEVAVIGVPHRDLGEAVVAIVVPRDPAHADAAEIITAVADKIARFKQPRAILFVDELPKNAMSKVQKAALREEYRQLFSE